LRNLALATGGRFFFAPTSDQLDALYGEIAAELRGATRYRLRAEWEVRQFTPEVISESGTHEWRPRLGYLPASTPEFVDIAALKAPRPFVSGLPPAATELAEVPLASRREPVRPSIPVGGEVVEIPTRGPDRPFVARIPGVPERIDLTNAASGPVRGTIPEFGTLTLSYRASSGEATAATLPPSVRPAFLLVLDSSGSMAEVMGGEKKYLAARRVMHELLRTLPDESVVGLRMFGLSLFWKRGQEPQPDASDKRYDTDSNLVVSVGPLDPSRRTEMQKWIEGAAPTGGTPLCYSLVQGLKDFPSERPGPRTVILISDGMESQGGRLEEVARAYGGAEVGLVIHVVGFDVGKPQEQEQLRAIARLGRGNYYHAANAHQLAEAIRHALRSARFVVHDENGKTVVGRGDINGDPVDLPSGTYQVSIPGTRIEPIRVSIAASVHERLVLDDQGKLTPSK
jgi:hypothetical protein